MASSFHSHSLLLILLLCSTLFLPFSSSQPRRPRTNFTSSDSPWFPNQTNRILVSPNSTFAAGFRSSAASPNLYTFSVWFLNVSSNDVVWSSNQLSPISSSGSLRISPSGDLRLLNSSSSTQNLWPSPSHSVGNGSALTLLASGNLIYGNFQSFNFPSDTILPGQQINQTTLVSKNGKFEFDSRKLSLISRNDSYWTNFGNASFKSLNDLGVLVYGDSSIFYASDYGVKKLRKLSLDDDGNLRLYSYHSESKQWVVGWKALFQLCLVHGICGENSICMYSAPTDSTSCQCPPGYKPRATVAADYSCELKTPIRLEKSKFLRLDFVNYTGGLNQSTIGAANFTVCEARCLANPKCLGFMFKYDGTNYCVLQLNTMADGCWSPATNTVMFLRVDESENDTSSFTGMSSMIQTMCPATIRLPIPPKESKAITRNLLIICSIFAAELFSGVFFFWTFLKKYTKYRDMARIFGLEVMPTGGPKRFSYAELRDATNNFSNEIGKGGFGVVHMGKLGDGRVVAVKSLKNIAGGDADFWAEVTIIARMHHLNLVHLWGFCAEKGRRILVYEYIPNGSLAEFLFQNNKSEDKPILDWNVRYRIALGVARAIAYLHEECLEWVLHCDIKPENILLAEDFCPKVSDFGLAKLKKKEDMMSVSRMRGTPGYMAPEWNRPEQITSKADVYSYGLVLLEIVSGSRNFSQLDSRVESDQWFFPRWAFDKVFEEMNVEEVLDHRIKDTYDSRAHREMIDRMVKTAMWCLQDKVELRPSMGKVAKMLEGTIEITQPKKPTIFFLED